MLASLAPMPTRTAPASGQHVRLQLAESSWVELTGADGSRIEYAMLPGGTTREYQVAGRASLRIGNIRGATLSVDGRPVDLSSYARANVARVSLGEELAAPSDPQ
jgi:cytoskeleton protein RodZ